jgi:hypothetical protein
MSRALLSCLLLVAACGGSESPSPDAGRDRSLPVPERALVEGGVGPDAAPVLDLRAPDGKPAADLGKDASKPDLAKVDGPKPDASKPKADGPKPDASKPKLDAPKPDLAKLDAPKPDAPKLDAPKPDAPKPDTKPPADAAPGAPLNPSPPAAAVRLVFIHHSVGEDWSSPFHGNLIAALNANKYYLSDSNYGWGGADVLTNDGATIGDHTDVGHWYNWFLHAYGKSTHLPALYATTHLTSAIAPNAIANPGGENTIVMFKSCFVSGDYVYGNPTDAPLAKGVANPIYGKEQSEDQYYTVANLKGIYRDLLDTFAAKQDKLFILVTMPPSSSANTSASSAANLRALNLWLVKDWLDAYPHKNVAVFDLHNVLTSSGGSPSVNDLGAATGSHHRYNASTKTVEHLLGSSNFLAYPSAGGDDHPTDAGHQKATGEYLPLLNVAYHCWKGSGGCPKRMGRD